MGLLEYLPADEPFLRECLRVLKPGGRAVITLRNQNCLERRLWKIYRKAGLEVVDTDYFFREHGLRAFRDLAGELGFVNFSHRLCHFYPLPWPASRFFSGLNDRLARRMEAACHSSQVDWLASTLVTAFEKPGG